MYYIKSQPNENGNYGNPVSNQREGMIALPDNLLSAYIATKGFADLTFDEDIVTAVSVNQDAYDAYMATVGPESEPEPDLSTRIANLEQRIAALESQLQEGGEE